jgi:lexA repressor|nr:MAG TPA: Repressor protein CI [Caudoviricetes sp.]
MVETFKDRLKALRVSKGLTQEDLSAKLKISRSTIGMYEQGNRQPDFDTLELIADFFNVDTDYLLGRTNKTTYIPHADLSGITNISFPAARPIPILGDICAGNGTWCEENFEGHFFIDSSIKADFCVKVRGDSMIDAGIYDGDLAFIKKTYDYINGKIYAVRINSDCEAVLKKVFWNNDTIILSPCNSAYEPSVTDSEGVSVVGECVGVYRATI